MVIRWLGGGEVKKKSLLLLFVICSSLLVVGMLGLGGCAVERQGSVNETAEYSYYTEIHTYRTPVLAVELEEGGRFRARLWVWKEDKFGSMTTTGWRIPSTVELYIQDPNGGKVIDAGRIGNEYEVDFTAEVAGDYQLIFDDRDGYCVVRIIHNSPEPMRDIGAQDN